MSPTPEPAKFNWPGLAFASAIRSLMVRAGTRECVIGAAWGEAFDRMSRN